MRNDEAAPEGRPDGNFNHSTRTIARGSAVSTPAADRVGEMQQVAVECGFVHISSPLVAEFARIARLNETSLDEAA